MLHLIPSPLHRTLLRIAYRLQRLYRMLAKPQSRGVSLIATDDAGRVLLVRHSYGTGGWSLPGGGMGRHEDPAACARRELREELDCEAADLRLLDTLSEPLSGTHQAAYIFTFRLVGEPKPDLREVIEARWFEPGALPGDLPPATVRRLALWRDFA